jgi:3-dehydroquinate synthase
LVIADISTLSTLPPREWKAGYAEVVKYGLINDPAFFGWLEANAKKMLGADAAALTHAVAQSCRAKAAIVAADEREAGSRALLNFGHTFAHALEAETGYSDALLHGEAVAIGMIMAFELSVKLGLCEAKELARVKAHWREAGLPASPLDIRKNWSVDALMEHFSRDKKAKGGHLTFVLTRGIGKAFVSGGTDPAAVQQAVAAACGVA